MTKPVDRYGVVGHPVSHSLSPFIHGLFARQTSQAMEYRRYDVAPADFRRWVLEFFAQGGRGLNVTVPHKRAAAELANQLTPRAERAGAANTLSFVDGNRVVADNTDGTGLVRDLRQNLQLRLKGSRILIIGAGGAARGVLGPLIAAHPAEVVIANRTPERAVELAREFPEQHLVRAFGFRLLPEVPYDVVINATSASLAGDLPDIGPGIFGDRTVAYDMAYGSKGTAFVHWARENGAATAVDGIGMLVEQAAESFQVWRGVRPSTVEALDALRSRALTL